MAADGKIGPSIGDVLKQGLAELRAVVIPTPQAPSAPQGPVMER